MDDTHIKIDEAHSRLINSLVCSQKPTRILEFGFGSGSVTDAILEALKFNGSPSFYTVVDNWADWGGKMPWTARLFENKVAFCNGDESAFVRKVVAEYDFIVCDADHQKTHENWQLIFDNLLAQGGIVVFHDVTNGEFPNLEMILTEVRNCACMHVLFNKNSRTDERCDRGLLVVFKS